MCYVARAAEMPSLWGGLYAGRYYTEEGVIVGLA
jgi:hypothetical protein